MDKKYLIASVLSLVLLFGVGIAWASAANNNTTGRDSDKSGSAEFKRPELGRQKVGGCGCGCDGSAETCPAGAPKRGLEIQAEMLGLTVEELQALFDSGKTMIQIAEEKGIDLEALREKKQQEMLEQRKLRLDKLVADGVITAEQAEERLSNLPEPGAKGFGKRGGGGCGCGGGAGNCSLNSEVTN